MAWVTRRVKGAVRILDAGGAWHSAIESRLRKFPMDPPRPDRRRAARRNERDRPRRRLVHRSRRHGRVHRAGSAREPRLALGRALQPLDRDRTCRVVPDQRAPPSPGPRPLPIRIQAGGYCGEDQRRNPVAEQLAEWPARDSRAAPRPGQGRLNVRWQLDPRDRPVGFGQIRRPARRRPTRRRGDTFAAC